MNTKLINRPLDDRDLIEASPFLADLVGQGRWKETGAALEEADPWGGEGNRLPSFKDFRRKFRKADLDPEAALLSLRRLRVRTLLALARSDIEERIRPHQIRARLRDLAEVMVHGSWWAAESTLRRRFVHPIILERHNINPPLAICSLSRLGAGDPWYTTGPAPIFVHARAAEFAPALTEKDFDLARRSAKEWLPAREYFHRLAGRTMSYLTAPDPAGKGFDRMDEAHGLGGPLVILLAAFERHFINHRPLKERLALIRLRFLVGKERLGRAVEAAARAALLKTADQPDSRLRTGINAWYRDRARAEGLPLIRGGLLDIERRIRFEQFRFARQDPGLLVPSPLKALDLLARAGLIGRDERLILSRSYNWQWFVINRLSLLGRRSALAGEALRSERLEEEAAQPGAAGRTLKHVKAAGEVLADLARQKR